MTNNGELMLNRSFMITVDDLAKITVLRQITGMNQSEIIRMGIRMVYAENVHEPGLSAVKEEIVNG